MNIPDNLDMYEAHDAEQEKRLERLPICIECGNPIQHEDAVETVHGWICDICLEDLRREIVAEW